MKAILLNALVALLTRFNPGTVSARPTLSRWRDRVLWAHISRAPNLHAFQQRDTFEILKVILERFEAPRTIAVLEVGCGIDVTKYLSHFVDRIVGINISHGQTRAEGCPSNVELHVMDAQRLTFLDRSFDFVFSANVNEHIADLARSLDEQLRVVRPGGFGYARWSPIWSSARGHHIHDDMVKGWEQELGLPVSGYRNDGTIIEDWSHLLFSEAQMRDRLASRFSSLALVDRIVESIYTRTTLNRLFFDDVERIVTGTAGLEVVSWTNGRVEPDTVLLATLRARHGKRDFAVASCQVLFRRA